MKHLLSIALIALVMSSMSPPASQCKPNEVWRCYAYSCMTTAMACPQVYEDGRLISSDCNYTNCNWDCECVQKTKPNPDEEVYD